MPISNIYYTVKFLIPRSVQLWLRRYLLRKNLSSYADIWPIDHTAGKPPERWTGWPDGKKFAFVLTHDVENSRSFEKCQILAEIEERRGFRSSFNFVIGDYEVPIKLRRYLIDHGFEIGVHGLTHRNNPFLSPSTFIKKDSLVINHHLKEWKSVGYRNPSMYHDLTLLHHLNIEYDASTFDTDPFEPQPDGMGTIFPFWVQGNANQGGYVELPYTLPQDFLLFILLKEQTVDIWKRKLDWIADHNGMALFIVHPNYMNFDKRPSFEEFPAKRYAEFLDYVMSQYKDQYWHILPREMARWWKDRRMRQTSSEIGETLSP